MLTCSDVFTKNLRQVYIPFDRLTVYVNKALISQFPQENIGYHLLIAYRAGLTFILCKGLTLNSEVIVRIGSDINLMIEAYLTRIMLAYIFYE